jgi:uncharacterized protein involved in tellurium resistance
MDLVQKGQEAAVNPEKLQQAMVSMRWTTAADFDLAVLIEKKSGGDPTMCYFGDKGNLNAFPYMELSGDEGVGDTGGDNEETMRITKIDPDIAKAHIVVWDYGKVTEGAPARFADSDCHVGIMDQDGNNHDVKLDCGDTGNVCVLATIDCTSPIGAKLVNTSKAGTIKGLKNANQILAIANQ